MTTRTKRPSPIRLKKVHVKAVVSNFILHRPTVWRLKLNLQTWVFTRSQTRVYGFENEWVYRAFRVPGLHSLDQCCPTRGLRAACEGISCVPPSFHINCSFGLVISQMKSTCKIQQCLMVFCVSKFQKNGQICGLHWTFGDEWSLLGAIRIHLTLILNPNSNPTPNLNPTPNPNPKP